MRWTVPCRWLSSLLQKPVPAGSQAGIVQCSNGKEKSPQVAALVHSLLRHRFAPCCCIMYMSAHNQCCGGKWCDAAVPESQNSVNQRQWLPQTS